LYNFDSCSLRRMVKTTGPNLPHLPPTGLYVVAAANDRRRVHCAHAYASQCYTHATHTVRLTRAESTPRVVVDALTSLRRAVDADVEDAQGSESVGRARAPAVPTEHCACGRSHGLWPRRRCARCGRSRRVQFGLKGIGVRLVEHGTHQERPATAHVSERDTSSACVAAMKLKLPTLEPSVSRQVQTP
jgi:hypothetical protein